MKRGEKVKRKQPKTQTAFAKARKIPTRKIPKSDVDKISKAVKKYGGKGRIAKKAAAPFAKKMVKKGVLRAISPAAAAVVAGVEGIRSLGKAACVKKGGRWVSGACKGLPKSKFKPGSKVRDPISKR